MKKSCHQPCKLAQILHHFLKANPKNTPPGDFFKTAAMWEGVKFFRPPPIPTKQQYSRIAWRRNRRKLISQKSKNQQQNKNDKTSDGIYPYSSQVVAEFLFTFL